MKSTKRTLSIALVLFLLMSLMQIPALAEDGEVTIYFVRHGKTLFNTIGKVQGYVDSPLTDEGIQGAEDTGMGLRDVKFDAAFCSDRGRAVETAEIILSLNAASEPLKLNALMDLREMNYGKYEGTATNIWQIGCEALGGAFPAGMGQFPMNDIVNAIAASDETGVCETYEETLERLMRGVDQVAASVKSGNVLCVSHGGAISNIATALGATVQGELPNASVTVVKYKDGKYTLGELGDMAQSEAGAAVRAANGGQAVYPDGKQPTSEIPAPGEAKVNLYLVRHGKTLLNAAGCLQGVADAPLTDAGIQGAINAGLGLKDIAFDAVYTSDLMRTTETVDLMLSMSEATPPEVPRTRLKDLREYSFGVYEADSQNDIFPLLMKAAGITDLSQLQEKGITFLGMYDLLANDENLVEKNAPFYERVNRGLDRIAAEMSQGAGEKNVLVCIHGMVMGAIMDKFGVVVEGEIPNAAVIQLVYQNGEYELVKDADGNYQNMSYQEQGATLNPYRVAEGAPEYPETQLQVQGGAAIDARDVDGTPYARVDQLAEAAGAHYSRDEQANQAIVTANGRRVALNLGTNLYYWDTAAGFTERPMFADGAGNAYAPVQAVCDGLGIAFELTDNALIIQ